MQLEGQVHDLYKKLSDTTQQLSSGRGITPFQLPVGLDFFDIQPLAISCPFFLQQKVAGPGGLGDVPVSNWPAKQLALQSVLKEINSLRDYLSSSKGTGQPGADVAITPEQASAT